VWIWAILNSVELGLVSVDWDLSGTRVEEPMTDSCEHGIEPTGSKKGGEFPDPLSQLFGFPVRFLPHGVSNVFFCEVSHSHGDEYEEDVFWTSAPCRLL
jgi:hypothetical protein